MTKYEISLADSFDVVRKICNTNLSVLNTYLPFVPVFAEFEVLVDALAVASRGQYVVNEGIAIGKQKRRMELESAAFYLSSSLLTFSKANMLPELEGRVKYSPTVLKKAIEKELVGICYQLMNDANDHLSGLAGYGIDAAWMTAFVAKIDSFAGLMGAPKFARENKKQATAEVKRLISEISTLLRTRLDVIMVYFTENHPSIYTEYKMGRKIVSQGSRSPALKGHVTDSEGNPMKGLIVRIAGTKRKSMTSEKGNFRFIQMKTGRYTVVVFDGKKEVGRMEVVVPHEGIIELRIAD